MKHYLIIFIILLVGGCSPIFYCEQGYKINVPSQVTTGSVLLFYEEGLIRKERMLSPSTMKDVVDGIRQELIYTGVDRNALHISYRELYSNSESKYARPAFGLELWYNLDDSKIITFREFIIRIDSIDASRINYTVMSGPDACDNKNELESATKVIIFELKDRKKVSLSFIKSNRITEGYLIGEDDFYYLISDDRDVTNKYYKVKKSEVKNLEY